MIQKTETLLKANVYHYTSVGMARFQNTTAPNVAEGTEHQDLSLTAGGDAEQDSYFGRQFGGFLQN